MACACLDTSIANGTFCGGLVIYGYELTLEPIPGKQGKYTKRIVINEEEANVMRYVFEQYDKGVSKKQIAADLNAQGIRVKGKPITHKTFDNYMKNTKYIGEFYFGERLCTNMYPPIIDKEMFERVQQRLASNRYFLGGKETAKEPYLLTGKLFCGHCGAEMVAGGGGGTGGGAILAGVGGGAGAYAVIMVNTEELPYNESGGTYSYAKVRVRIKPLNDSPSSSDYGGIGASNRGSATSGRDVEVVYEESGEEKIVITCQGGKGANAGDAGSGGTINISDGLPEAISVLYYTNGLSANGGVSANTITCPQNTLIVGFENEGDEYKLTRGGFNGVTEGGGASSGAPSQFGNGGIEGKTNNGYDGGDADINANGAGGGGGHGKAFSQSNGGNGGRPKIIVYTEPIEPITFSNASWTEIDNIASVGKASVFFSVGDEKTITLSTGEKITLVILGFDHDDLSNSSGKAKITIGMKNLLTTDYKMESSSTCWGWDRSYMRNYTMPALFLELPADLQKVIKPVNKRAMEGLGSTDIVISSDKLWLLAEAEIEEKDNTSPYLAEGEQYEYWRSVKDGNNYKDRIKYLSNDESRASSWWLRSSDTLFKNQYSIVDPQGHMSSSSPSSDTRISYCFCV